MDCRRKGPPKAKATKPAAKKLRNLHLSLFALSGAILTLTGCYYTFPDGYYGRSGPHGRGETQYLEGFGPPPIYRGPAQRGVLQDTVSYWDGEGVSGSPAITIDLSQQKAFFYKGDQLVGVARVSTGREGFNTPSGDFKVSEKDIDHKSNLYGDFVDASGQVVVRDVDIKKDIPPPGTRFEGSPMSYFMRVHGAVGMHAGYLPGYAASHGCIRLPEHMARSFYHNASYGTPVRIVH